MRGREEWALAEVEQGVTLAAQQLQLAANVQGAVLALQSADARLAGNTRPQFIGLRKVLARDLDRLPRAAANRSAGNEPATGKRDFGGWMRCRWRLMFARATSASRRLPPLWRPPILWSSGSSWRANSGASCAA